MRARSRGVGDVVLVFVEFQLEIRHGSRRRHADGRGGRGDAALVEAVVVVHLASHCSLVAEVKVVEPYGSSFATAGMASCRRRRHHVVGVNGAGWGGGGGSGGIEVGGHQVGCRLVATCVCFVEEKDLASLRLMEIES